MFHELGGSAPDCRPLLFDIPATPGEEDVAVADVLNLTDRLRPDGTLDWNVPQGNWTIFRFGHTPTNSHVSTSSGDWQGSVLDYMSEAVSACLLESPRPPHARTRPVPIVAPL